MFGCNHRNPRGFASRKVLPSEGFFLRRVFAWRRVFLRGGFALAALRLRFASAEVLPFGGFCLRQASEGFLLRDASEVFALWVICLARSRSPRRFFCLPSFWAGPSPAAPVHPLRFPLPRGLAEGRSPQARQVFPWRVFSSLMQPARFLRAGRKPGSMQSGDTTPSSKGGFPCDKV